MKAARHLLPGLVLALAASVLSVAPVQAETVHSRQTDGSELLDGSKDIIISLSLNDQSYLSDTETRWDKTYKLNFVNFTRVKALAATPTDSQVSSSCTAATSPSVTFSAGTKFSKENNLDVCSWASPTLLTWVTPNAPEGNLARQTVVIPAGTLQGGPTSYVQLMDWSNTVLAAYPIIAPVVVARPTIVRGPTQLTFEAGKAHDSSNFSVESDNAGTPVWTITPALPKGLTFDSATARIQGTPEVAVTNSLHTVMVSLTGATGSMMVNVTVKNPLVAVDMNPGQRFSHVFEKNSKKVVAQLPIAFKATMALPSTTFDPPSQVRFRATQQVKKQTKVVVDLGLTVAETGISYALTFDRTGVMSAVAESGQVKTQEARISVPDGVAMRVAGSRNAKNAVVVKAELGRMSANLKTAACELRYYSNALRETPVTVQKFSIRPKGKYGTATVTLKSGDADSKRGIRISCTSGDVTKIDRVTIPPKKK